MNKANKMHLENINPTILEEWRSENAFSCFASSIGKNGNIKLGVDGFGRYEVRADDLQWYFTKSNEAIEKYTELLTKG